MNFEKAKMNDMDEKRDRQMDLKEFRQQIEKLNQSIANTTDAEEIEDMKEKIDELNLRINMLGIISSSIDRENDKRDSN